MKQLTAKVLDVCAPDYFQGCAESETCLVLATSLTSLTSLDDVHLELAADYLGRDNVGEFSEVNNTTIDDIIDLALTAHSSVNDDDEPYIPSLDDGLEWPEDPGDVNWFHTDNTPFDFSDPDERGFYFTESSGHEIDSFSGPYDTWGQMVRAASETHNWMGYEESPYLYLRITYEDIEPEIVTRDHLITLISQSVISIFNRNIRKLPTILRHGHKGYLNYTDAELNEAAEAEGLHQRVATDAND